MSQKQRLQFVFLDWECLFYHQYSGGNRSAGAICAASSTFGIVEWCNLIKNFRLSCNRRAACNVVVSLIMLQV